MTEVNQIRFILEHIRKDLNMKSCSEWSNADYVFLSDKIKEKTNELISDRTLRRLYYAFLLNGPAVNPKISTLDVFAKYAGYGSWKEFETKHNTIPIKKPSVKKKKPTRNIVFLISLLVLFVILFPFFKPKKNTISLKLEYEYLWNYPNTLTFIYQLPKNTKDQYTLKAHLDQAVFMNRFKVEKLSGLSNKHSIFIKEPGMYNMTLLRNNEAVLVKPFFLLSKKWLYSIYSKDRVFVAHDSVLKKDGFVTVIPEKINKRLDSLERNRVDISYFNKLPVLLDKSHIELRFKNLYFEDFLGCNLCKITLYGKQNDIRMYLSDQACFAETKIKVAEISHEEKSGKNVMPLHDYSAWTTLTMDVDSNIFELSLDGKPAFTTNYQKPLDTLMGLRFWFLEGGAVDYFRVYSPGDSLIYAEEFE